MTTQHILLFLIPAFLYLAGCAPAGKIAPEAPTPPAKLEVKVSTDAQAIYYYLASREFAQERKPDLAAQALEKAVEISPSEELYLELGTLYWRMSRFPDAHASLKAGLEKFPESKLLLLGLAKTYAVQKRFDDAVLTLDDYRKTQPDLVDLEHEAAAYRIEQKEFGDAVDRLHAIPSNKATTMTHFLLGKAYFGLSFFSKAIDQYSIAVRSNPEFTDAWVEMALTYEAQKNFIDSERIFSQLFDNGFQNQQTTFHLVDLNLKLNNPDRALSFIQQSAEDRALTLEAANLFINQNFFNHAGKLLDPLTTEGSVPVNALFPLAILEYEGRHNIAKAREFLEKIPSSHQHYERSLLFRIHLLYQDGKLDEAKQLCQSSMKTFPKQPDFPILLAEMYDLEKQSEQSQAVLTNAHQTWPDNMTILFRLGLTYDRLNQTDRAMQIMEEVIAKDPDHDDALNYLGYTLADKNMDLDRALVLVQQAIRVKPDNGYYLDSLAWVYYRQGKLKLAWLEIKRAVELSGNDPVIWEHYGDIASAHRLPSEARKGYTKSLRLGGSRVHEVKAKLDALGKGPVQP